MERQFVQSAVHVRPVLDFIADTAHILEHDDRVREILCELHDSTGETMQHPFGESFFLVTEVLVDARPAVFLTASGDDMISLTFLLDPSVVKDERALRSHRVAVEGCERNVVLVDGHTNQRVTGSSD